jgi:glycosyltransferase involved in cell wall biosynthesis
MGSPMSDQRVVFERAAEAGLVSVIIPTYNRAGIVARAITSALRQSYSSVQVIVIDDGSTDDTPAVLDAFGDRIERLSQPNAGVTAARNAALEVARGEFVAFLDSDDEWLDWKLETEVAALRVHPSAVLVWTDMTAVDPEGRVVCDRYLRTMYAAYSRVDFDAAMGAAGTVSGLVPAASPDIATAAVRIGDLSSQILIGNLVHTSTVLLRRTCIEAVGGFDTRWRNGGEDYEFYTRVCARGPVVLIDAPSIRYRVGADDQITAPHKLLNMAQRDLETVRARFAEPARRNSLPRPVVRQRLAWSLEWVGSSEFEIGRRGSAARHLAHSLGLVPRVDRRLWLLAACALPPRALAAIRAAKRKWRGSAGATPQG